MEISEQPPGLWRGGIGGAGPGEGRADWVDWLRFPPEGPPVEPGSLGKPEGCLSFGEIVAGPMAAGGPYSSKGVTEPEQASGPNL